MNNTDTDTEEKDYAGDMTIEEFKKILRAAIEAAMKEALAQAERKSTKPAHKTKENRNAGATTYGKAGGITFKG